MTSTTPRTMNNRILGTQPKIENPYDQYEIKAMDGIYSAIDEFQAMDLDTTALYAALELVAARKEVK
tara:strand:- start:515 stop:715 length:201 start_codon:yes stop_codon:yes gene_type:complete